MGAVRPTMREEHHLMIALEADIWILMSITATGEWGSIRVQ